MLQPLQVFGNEAGLALQEHLVVVEGILLRDDVVPPQLEQEVHGRHAFGIVRAEMHTLLILGNPVQAIGNAEAVVQLARVVDTAPDGVVLLHGI